MTKIILSEHGRMGVPNAKIIMLIFLLVFNSIDFLEICILERILSDFILALLVGNVKNEEKMTFFLSKY